MKSYLNPFIKSFASDSMNERMLLNQWVVAMEEEIIAARKILVGLEKDISAARLELLSVQQQKEVNLIRNDRVYAQLREANEQLVIALASATSEAASAIDSLEKAAWAGQHDSLTNAPNRVLMLDRIAKSIAMAERNDTLIALLFVDVDRFKIINDTLGHEVGDGVLQMVARRLERSVRNVDTVSRHGGDEFLILLNDIKHKDDVDMIAKKNIVGHQRTS